MQKSSLHRDEIQPGHRVGLISTLYTLLLFLGKIKILLATYQNKSPNRGFRHRFFKKSLNKFNMNETTEEKVHEPRYT